MLTAFSHLRLRYKIGLPIALLMALYVVMGGAALLGSGALGDSNARLTGYSLVVLRTLLNADRDLYQAQVAERSLLGGHAADVEGQRAFHRENLQQALDRVRQYRATGPGPEPEALVDTFEQQFARWKAVTERVVADPTAAEATRLSFGEGETLFQASRDAIDKLVDLEEARVARDSAAATALVDSIRIQQIALVAVGSLVCLALVVLVPPLVTGPLQTLLGRLREIASGDGDLRSRLEVRSRDEVGQVGEAFNRFLDTLQPLIQQATRVSQSMDEAARELADKSSTTARLIDDEHASVDQVSTAATEMSAAVNEVARNAQSTSAAAHEAAGMTLDGARVVDATIATMRQLAQDVEHAAATVHRLEDESASIGAVLAVIRGIAEQTNLLALNAAIEAARAGEQGRGFAVVADEVRALAARTQESTKDINERIERLNAGVLGAVQVMQAGCERARTSVEQAAEVDRALSGAKGSVSRISDMAAQIATACEEQSSVTEEISRNINDIRDLSDGALDTARQGREASERVASLAVELSALLRHFKV